MSAARFGPRPLGVHLGLATSIWLSGLGGTAVAGTGTGTGTGAEAARERFDTLKRGIEAYWAHPYRRAAPQRTVLWQAGTTRLLDYTPAGAPPAKRAALLVPSLVNRAYILDLAPNRSLTAYLAAHGVRPLVVDWGAPGEAEQAFDLNAYITRRLVPAFDAAARHFDGPLDLIGYCMGGILTLALALLRGERCAALALLATPWDFHAEDPGWGRVLAALEPVFGAVVEREGVLPVDLLQACFAVTQPASVADKFSAFAALDPTGDDALAFVQVEDWLNDGVPLAGPVARECLFGWYGDNTPARGMWMIDGRTVDPSSVDLPTLAFIPSRDKVVPPGSARALADAIPGARGITPRAGHVGMVVGRDAERVCWAPLVEWLFASAK